MKIKPGTIVVGVDGSESAAKALDWAAEQARVERRQITLVHAVGAVSPAWIDAAVAEPREANLSLRQHAHALLTEARERIEGRAPEVEVQEVFRLEDPREVLLELSATAEMVVLGSHGRGPVRRLLLGSVGVALARHSECPVVIHRPGKTGAVRHGVAVGADGSPESRTVLEFAFRQAALHDLPLLVSYSAWDSRGMFVPGYPVSDPEANETEDRLLLSESMAGLAEKYPDVRAQVELSHGMPESTLMQLTEKMNLVVLGAHRRNFADRFLHGSVSVAVLERAGCPVAVVPLTDQS